MSDDPDFLLAEALRFRRAGRWADAAQAARHLTEVAPERLDGWFVWGTAAMASGRWSEAEQVLGEGARHAPERARVRFLVPRARALVTLGRAAEAVMVAREAVPDVGQAADLNTLSAVFSQAGLPEEAVPLSERATERDTVSSDVWNNLGSLYQFLGRMDDAEAALEKAVAAGPNAAAHLALARLRKWTAERNHLERLKAAPRRTAIDTARLGYALFKELDDLGRYDESWDWLAQGAKAGREAVGGWDAAGEAETVAAWKAAFPSPAPFTGRGDPVWRDQEVVGGGTSSSPRRIFIFGLPRSGTTLIERVLTAHSQVQALGELQTFGLAVKRVSGSTTPHLLDADTVRLAAQADPAEIARRYAAETAYLWDGQSAFAIDKLPHNSDYAGLIRRAFPDAILIHVRRDPMDSLFGAYRLMFAHAHKWSYSFDDLAAHYDHYRQLMGHWKAVLGEGLIEVSLEAVIADPEAQIRALLDACNLSFEAACLSPHEAKGAVTTASSAQVRRPINADGVGVWRRYEAGLTPLYEALAAKGYVG